jgi:hypothetical protein
MGSGTSSQHLYAADEVDEEIFKELEGKYNLLKNDGSTDLEIAQSLKSLLQTRQAEADAKLKLEGGGGGDDRPPLNSSPTWAQLHDFVPNESFQEGDIVQVHATDSMLFFEAVITNVNDEDETVDVKYKDGDESEQEDECGISMHSSRLRKVFKWDHLETGEK